MEKFEKALKDWFSKDEIENLFTNEVKDCINKCQIPKKDDIFNAFDGLKPQDVKVLIIGQDPYPDENRAHGLAFSFKNGELAPQDSLKNIFDKIEADTGKEPTSTNLKSWREQGVLLLNTALTFTSEDERDMHSKAWKPFIYQVLDKLIAVKNNEPLAIMLWGSKANELKQFEFKGLDFEDGYKAKYPNFKILRSSHPTNNYGACDKPICGEEIYAFNDENYQPFKECNEFLESKGITKIEWWKTY